MLLIGEEIAKSQMTEVYTQIPDLNKAVGSSVLQMIRPFLPEMPKSKISPYPKYVQQPKLKERHPVSIQSGKVASDLDKQIAELEASMEFLLSANARKKERKKKMYLDLNLENGQWI